MHLSASHSERHSRPAQAFILGWPLANLGGVNEVVKNLVHEFSQSGNLAPLVIEAMDDNEGQGGEEHTTSTTPYRSIACLSRDL